MNMMFCVPAAVASSIVACRSFVSLASFLHSDVYICSTTGRRNTRRPGVEALVAVTSSRFAPVAVVVPVTVASRKQPEAREISLWELLSAGWAQASIQRAKGAMRKNDQCAWHCGLRVQI